MTGYHRLLLQSVRRSRERLWFREQLRARRQLADDPYYITSWDYVPLVAAATKATHSASDTAVRPSAWLQARHDFPFLLRAVL